MTYYTCPRCGALLETDERLVGRQESCPKCRSVNVVPAERTRRPSADAHACGDSAIISLLGGVLLIVGASLAGFGLTMGALPVSGGGLLIASLGYGIRRAHCLRTARMTTANRFCANCGVTVAASKPRLDRLLHLALILASCGVWLIPLGLWIARHPWRCGQCGKPITPKPVGPPPPIPEADHDGLASGPVAPAAQRPAPAADYGSGWSPAQRFGFILFMLVGLPLLRAMCNSGGASSTSAPELSAGVVSLLPDDGVYSQPAGAGGGYTDPMNGYFAVEPPADWEIIEKRDKATFKFGRHSPQDGRVAPRSWIVFRKGRFEIGAIARETYSTIERDFDLVVKEYPTQMGASVQRSRYVIIDGARGGELLCSVQGLQVFLVKYKKHGLDHAITMTCPISDAPSAFPEFLRFLRTYRSLAPRDQGARGTADTGRSSPRLGTTDRLSSAGGLSRSDALHRAMTAAAMEHSAGCGLNTTEPRCNGHWEQSAWTKCLRPESGSWEPCSDGRVCLSEPS